MIPEIETINLVKLASGDCLYLQIYKFIGQNVGKKVYIQANLHGCEIVGNAVIYQLIDYLSNLDNNAINGQIWLVPVCNPLSTNQRDHFFSTGRYNPYDGKDWNRIFWDYEKECLHLDKLAQSYLNDNAITIQNKYLEQQKQAFAKQLDLINKPCHLSYNNYYRYQLQSLSIDTDYVIDIHSSSNQGMDYIYCFQGQEESAKYFLLDYGILMNEYDGDTFDEAFLKPWLALEKKLAQLGKTIKFDKESWTLELGSGMSMNPQSINKGVQGIKNYLAYKGVINYQNKELENTSIKLINKSQIQKYYAPTGGMIQNRIALGSYVKSGDKLYQIISFNKIGLNPDIIEVSAEQNGLLFDSSTNQAVNQGEYVLSIIHE